jgi:steroid delta-isomerase-like uncharacterized protein
MKKLLAVLPLALLFCFVLSCQQATEEKAETGLTQEELNAMTADVIKVYNNGDMDALDRVYAADYVEHDPLEGETVGIDAFKQRIRAMHEMYSSIDLSIDETFIKDDKAAVLWSVKETLASGQEINVSGVNIVSIVDGKIAEVDLYYDTKSALEQMGYKIIPPEEQEKK